MQDDLGLVQYNEKAQIEDGLPGGDHLVNPLDRGRHGPSRIQLLSGEILATPDHTIGTRLCSSYCLWRS